LKDWTISHDWQIEWLLKHKTLEELSFVDCSINRVVFDDHALDREKYPLFRHHHLGYWDSVWLYDKQWADVYAAIEQGLPKLHSFSSTRSFSNLEDKRDYSFGYSALEPASYVRPLFEVLLQMIYDFQDYPPRGAPVSPQAAAAASVPIAQSLAAVTTKEEADTFLKKHGTWINGNLVHCTPEFDRVDWEPFVREFKQNVPAADAAALQRLQETLAMRRQHSIPSVRKSGT
jgi:hypothetical protein